MNILMRISIAFLLFLAVSTPKVMGESDKFSVSDYSKGIEVHETFKGYRGTKITLSVSTNATYSVSISLFTMGGNQTLLFSDTLVRDTLTQLDLIEVRLQEGGVIRLDAVPAIDLSNVTQVIFSIDFYSLIEQEVLLRAEVPYISVATLVLTLGTLLWLWRRGITQISYFGRVSSIDMLEFLTPPILALMTFSYLLPNFVKYVDVYQMISADIQEGMVFSPVYWALITLVGHVYFSRREKDVKNLWTKVGGRQKTYIFRSLYAFKNVILVLGQTIIYYFVVFYTIFIAYIPSTDDWLGVLFATAVYSWIAVFHLLLFSTLSTFLGTKTQAIFFAVNYIVDVLGSGINFFTTYPQAVTRNLTVGSVSMLSLIPSIVVAVILLFISYTRYTLSEVVR